MREYSSETPLRVEEAEMVITNMVYPQCAGILERNLKSSPYVIGASVSFATGHASISYDADGISWEDLIQIIEDAGYKCRECEQEIVKPSIVSIKEGSHSEHVERKGWEAADPARQPNYALENEHTPEGVISLRNASMITLMLTIGMIITSSTSEEIPGFSIQAPVEQNLLHFIFATPAVLYGGSFFFTAAWRAIRQHTTNTATLVSVAVLSLYLYSVGATFLEGISLYMMTGILLTLVLFGHWLEASIRRRATGTIQSLLNLAPHKANIIKDDNITTVHVEELQVGDTIAVRPGEKVPVDGVIVGGQAIIDQSPIIGEVNPAIKRVGDEVIGSTINRGDTFKMRAIHVGGDTALAQIIKFIAEAQRSRAHAQRIVDAVASSMVPLVIALGAIAFVFWKFIAQQEALFALSTGVATIIIACPYALSLAAPVAVTIGTGLGVRQGILIKGATAMEKASKLDIVLFDKMGVLTEGKPVVSDIVHVGKLTQPGFLRLAAGFGKASEYIFAKAIMEVAERQVGLALPTPSEFRAIPGYGVVGRIETRSIIVGNKRLMTDSGIDVSSVEERAGALADQGKAVVYVAVSDRIEGILGIADSIRPESKEAVRRLKEAGIGVALLTEEDVETTNAIASELGVDKVYAEVLPAGKAEKIRDLQQKGKLVGMVGDSMYDAATLAQADLGIVIGVGTNIAFKPGEIILIGSNPLKAVDAIMLSRLIIGKIKQNILWGTTYNSVAILLAAGIAYPSLGIFVRPEIAAIATSAGVIAITVNSLFLKREAYRSRLRNSA